MAKVTEIKFTDFEDRERSARDKLRESLRRLRNPSTDAEKAEKARLEKVVTAIEAEEELPKEDRHSVFDPLWVALRDTFNDPTARGILRKILLNPKDGVLRARGVPRSVGQGQSATRASATSDGPPQTNGEITDDDVVRVAHVLGILANGGVVPPRVVLVLRKENAAGEHIATDRKDPQFAEFTTAFYSALGEVQGSFTLASLVLPILQKEGDRDSGAGSAGEVQSPEFAKVMNCLGQKGVTDREAQLTRRVNACLNSIQAIGDDAPMQDLSISLPDLNAVTAFPIQAKHVDAVGPVVCAAMFDELKAFEVLDTVLEQWQQGRLTTSLGEVGELLYDYWRSAPNRMSQLERRNLCAQLLGTPVGSTSGPVNRDFSDLWMRFVASVSSLVRQRTTDNLLRANIPSSISQQQVRKAARDLALNLSSHSYGMVTFAARDLQQQIAKLITILNHKEMRATCGADDMWGVIDHYATLYLPGGAKNSARYRTLATCGAIITKWLSLNVEKYNSTTSLRPVIDLAQVLADEPQSAGQDATRRPTDYDLVNACELWLSDTAVAEQRVEEMAQPHESPVMTSKPIPVPAIAREILEDALPVGLGYTTGRR